jgi:hypothetical protein
MPSLFHRTLLAAATVGIACAEVPTEPVTPTEVTLKFCGAPAWIAYQDGDGAWTEAKGVATGAKQAYTFTMTSAKGGVALVRRTTCSTLNVVTYGTAAELAKLYPGKQCGTPGGKTIHGSFTGSFAGGYAIVGLGGWYDQIYGESGKFTLEEVDPGPQDLVASRGNAGSRDRIIIRRAIDVADNATLPVLDFNSSEAIALDSATLSIQEFGGSGVVTNASVFSSIYTANGGRGVSSAASANGTTWYRGLPASATIAGDIHQIGVLAGGRYLDMFVGPLANLAVSLGPVAATPTVTTLSDGTPKRMRMTVPVQAEYPGMAFARFETGHRPYFNVTVTMTKAYRGSASSWILEVPDFGASSGYDASWSMSGPLRSWGSEVYGWDAFAEFIPTIGLTRRRAGTASTFPAASALPSPGETESRQLRLPTSMDPRYSHLSCSA